MTRARKGVYGHKRHVGVLPSSIASLKQNEYFCSWLLSWLLPFSDPYINLIHVSILIISALVVIYMAIILVTLRVSYGKAKERQKDRQNAEHHRRWHLCGEHRSLYRPPAPDSLEQAGQYDPVFAVWLLKNCLQKPNNSSWFVCMKHGGNRFFRLSFIMATKCVHISLLAKAVPAWCEGHTYGQTEIFTWSCYRRSTRKFSVRYTDMKEVSSGQRYLWSFDPRG